MRSRPAALCVLASTLCLASVAKAETWPTGPAPCAGTLQTCIDGVASGASIEIATNTPIAETVTISDKIVNLLAAPGFAPSFAPAGSVTIESPTTLGATVIRGLAFDHSSVRGLAGAGNLTVAVIESSFVHHNGDAITVFSTGQTPGDAVELDVLDSTFVITNDPGNEGSAVQLQGLNANDMIRLSMLSSVMTQHDGDSVGAVSVYSISAPAVSLFLRHNEIRRSGANRGIFLRKDNPGDWEAYVLNNLIVGSPDTTGTALELDAPAGVGAYLVQVTDNTFAVGDGGVHIANSLDGLLANNILADFSDFGLNVSGGGSGVVDNRFNLFFNASSNVAAGPGTVLADPQFVGGGNYRLGIDSPARNAGANADVPSQVTVDLDQGPRVNEGVVDLGAYEYVAAVVEVPTVSGHGLAALAGLILLAGLWVLRRP